MHLLRDVSNNHSFRTVVSIVLNGHYCTLDPGYIESSMKEDNNRKDIEKLEHYLAGDLTAEEKEVIETRLESDSVFLELYKMLKHLPIATRKSHLEALLQRLKSTESNVKRKE
ncbi:MAG: hypothetical protein KDC53_13100 [Saprospiraceae bacterium]|nr:hypothetical protein [Saprospiraceae bacterium]